MMRYSCIYCPASFDHSGEGDHIIPAVLGEFRGFKQFRKICSSCNSAIGHSETQLLRCGPEAMLCRDSRPPTTRRPGPRKLVGGAGAPAPRFLHESHGVEFLVKVTHKPHPVPEIPNQIVIKFTDGGSHPVEIFDIIDVSKICQLLEPFATQRIQKIHIQAEGDVFEAAKAATCAVWRNASYEEATRVGETGHRSIITTRCEFTDKYFRSILKIAFHYYLTYSQSKPDGRHARFDGIRDYVLNGGNPERFFLNTTDVPVEFRVPLNVAYEARMPGSKWWSHMLWVDADPERVIVAIHLFYGPGCFVYPHCVNFGRVAVDRECFAHLLSWKPQEHWAGKGVVDRLPVRRTH